MKIIAANLLSGLVMVAQAADIAPEKAALKIASEQYERLVSKLAPTNVPFVEIYKEPLTLGKFGVDIKADHKGKSAVVYAQFDFQFEIETGRMFKIANHQLAKHIETNTVNRVPALSVREALARAKGYLDIIGVNLPPNMVLKSIVFDKEVKNKPWWVIVWEPAENGYPWDDSELCYPHEMSVAFHEQYGFLWFSRTDFWPTPKATEVKIAQDAAIAKAEKAVPLVMRTPFYKSRKLSGFKPSGALSARLMVSAPNWLLDPERAIWIWEKAPEETRLCWVVTFRTVDTVDRGKGVILSCPQITVYIDAATGEIVGATF